MREDTIEDEGPMSPLPQGKTYMVSNPTEGSEIDDENLTIFNALKNKLNESPDDQLDLQPYFEVTNADDTPHSKLRGTESNLEELHR